MRWALVAGEAMGGRLLTRRLASLRRVVAIRTLLSPAFRLDSQWAQRHGELAKLGLGGDYEWIATVQKKFIGGGLASTVDADVAACMAEQKDQVEDVLDILRKLRHSPSAAKVFASSQYAVLRLLLSHKPDEIINLVLDPINNGIFADEHSACLLIDHFIEGGDIPVAARIGAWTMQQEMFSSSLLNSLSLYASLRWTELPAEQRTFPGTAVEEEEINDEDIVTLKVPFLKNDSSDGHFDLVEGRDLVGKAISWLAREADIEAALKSDCSALSSVVGGSVSPSSISSFSPSAAKSALLYLQGLPESSEEQKEIIEKLTALAGNESTPLLSSLVLNHLKAGQEAGEMEVAKAQEKRFTEWNERRKALIKAQAERVQLNLRRLEVEEEMASLDHHEEKLFFFEKRLDLERMAKENAEIASQTTEAQAAKK